MQQKYGEVANWYRKKSHVTANFIDRCRQATIDAWNEKESIEKSLGNRKKGSSAKRTWNANTRIRK